MVRSSFIWLLLVGGCAGTIADGGPATESDGQLASDAGSADGRRSAPAPHATTVIRVHYPAGAHTLRVRGLRAPLAWDRGEALEAGPDDTWTFRASVSEPVEFKVLLDDAVWSRGPNYHVAPGITVDVYPHFIEQRGRYARAYTFSSQTLGNDRGIWIYQPPTYLENTRAALPVVYMHDGQNLFDHRTAYGGTEWRVDEAMDAAAEDGSIAEALVIGVESTADRLSEYTPVQDAQVGGGRGDAYLRMLVDELKPRIDRELRTRPDAAHTAVLGSSLGGLMSAYAGVKRADVFGHVGALSPSTWWSDRWLLGAVSSTPATPRPLRVYVDSGDAGTSSDGVEDTRQLAATYRTLGYADGSTLRHVVEGGGQHNEASWARRVPGALAFLLGPGR